MLSCLKSYDRNISAERALRLELAADECLILPSLIILAVGLEYIWENRKQKLATPLFLMRAELEAAVSLRRKSRNKYVREAANIMCNMIVNFFVPVPV